MTHYEDFDKVNGPYGCIYGDPAWEEPGGGNRSPSVHYPTMSTEAIASIPVRRIASRNCLLFMWATEPMIFKGDAFKVVRRWGFKPVTFAFTWTKKYKSGKPFMGMGGWTRSNPEFCILGTRGSPVRHSSSVSEWLHTTIEEHSKKPDVVRDLIVQIAGDVPRIELFARQSARGWDTAWSNELSCSKAQQLKLQTTGVV